MRCPYCGGLDTQVKDSRPTEDASSIRRRRICSDCGGRFTTFERVQLRELMVVKKNDRAAAVLSGWRLPFPPFRPLAMARAEGGEKERRARAVRSRQAAEIGRDRA